MTTDPSSDVVERLRLFADLTCWHDHDRLARDAIATIERLSAELERVKREGAIHRVRALVNDLESMEPDLREILLASEPAKKLRAALSNTAENG